MDLRIFTEPQQGASYDDLLAVARRAERCGYSAFFRSDHYLSMGDVDPMPGPTDAWTSLAGLARETSRIRLGTLVTSATFRNPGVLAVQVAQVDQMSGGRVELGIGAGWYEAEHRAYGIEFPPVGERFDRLEEQLEVITGLWRTPVGGRFRHDGRYYPVSDSPALPKPVQERVPVIIGGQGRRRTPQLAARFATEFNRAFDSAENVGTIFGWVRQACEQIGRDPGELDWSAALVLCCGRDEAEFRRRAEAIGRDPKELRANGAAGTPDEVVDTLRRYADVGVERIYLQVLDLDDLDHLDLVAESVAPYV
jgi:F420-dependent oxidoreductase-like protein